MQGRIDEKLKSTLSSPRISMCVVGQYEYALLTLLRIFVHEAMRSMHGSSKIPRKSICQVVFRHVSLATFPDGDILMTIEGRQGLEKLGKV